MKTIDVIYNQRQMKQILRRLKSSDGQRCFTIFSPTAKYIIKKLTRAGWKEAPPVQWTEHEREQFLKEYVELIDQCGTLTPRQRIWWASYIASKNRFASHVPELLQQFLTILKFSESSLGDHLILINPSWTILSAVQMAMRRTTVRFKYPNVRWRSGREMLYRRLYHTASTLYQVLRLSSRCFYARYIYRGVFPLLTSNARSWYVMKSFIYNHSFKEGTYHDIFFGPLLPFLERYRQVIIFGTILGNYSQCLRHMRQITSVMMVPIELMFRLREIVRAAGMLLYLKVHIQSPILFFKYEVGSILNNEFRRTVNGIDLYHYLHYDATRRFLQGVTPVSTFLYTYENNPWERMCVLAFRKWSSTTQIIGYQQNVVPQASANLFIGQRERQQRIVPDRVLTTGETPKRILEKYGAYEPGYIQVGCGLRFSKMIPSQPTQTNPVHYRILVAMEGIIEVYKMVNLVLRQLGGDEQYHIRLRAHPVLSVDVLRRYFIKDLTYFSNVEVSHGNTLAEDIAWADIVVYWGSTVALEALTMGKRLVYYNNSSMVSYDPLFECTALKRTVSDYDDLREKIRELLTLPKDSIEKEKQDAFEYTRQYIFPVTDKQLSLFN